MPCEGRTRKEGDDGVIQWKFISASLYCENSLKKPCLIELVLVSLEYFGTSSVPTDDDVVNRDRRNIQTRVTFALQVPSHLVTDPRYLEFDRTLQVLSSLNKRLADVELVQKLFPKISQDL